MLLSIAIFSSGTIMIADLFVTSRKTGVYVIVVQQMLTADVLMVLLVLAPFLLTFALAMWPILPTYRLHVREDFSNFLSMVWSMLIMIFTGNSALRMGDVHTDMDELMYPEFLLLSQDWNLQRRFIPECEPPPFPTHAPHQLQFLGIPDLILALCLQCWGWPCTSASSSSLSS